MNIATQRLSSIMMLPELRAIFQHMMIHDTTKHGYRQRWSTTIQEIQVALGADSAAITPFVSSWELMYSAISHLDHIQDRDIISDSVFLALEDAQRYNVVFGYYVFAECVLSELTSLISADRVLRLRTCWSEAMLRMASGQYRDLLFTNATSSASPHSYQEIAQAKTGATFALGFGGAAMLHTDDVQIISALQFLGEIYGTLLQYSDDLLDSDAQQNATLTLPTIFEQAHPHMSQPTSKAAFWMFVYRSYYKHALGIAQTLPETIRNLMLGLFTQTFGAVQIEESTYAV